MFRVMNWDEREAAFHRPLRVCFAETASIQAGTQLTARSVMLGISGGHLSRRRSGAAGLGGDIWWRWSAPDASGSCLGG